jgi:hypothetical protein
VQPRTDHEPLTVQLRRLARWLVPGLLVALMATAATSYRIQLFPPSLERDSAEYAAASTQVLLDFPGESALLDASYSVGPLAERADVYARLGAAPAVTELIAEEAGLEASQIDAHGPYNPDAQRVFREPTAERRAGQLSDEPKGYRLRFDVEESRAMPIVLVYAQAPTVEEAERLADAGAVGLSKFANRLQEEQGIDDDERLHLRQLGGAEGGVVNPGADREIAVLAFVAGLFAWAVLVLLAMNLRDLFRRRAAGRPDPRAPGASTVLDGSEVSLDRPLARSGP